MAPIKTRITPAILYSLRNKGGGEKIQDLDQLINSAPEPYLLYKDYYKRLREATIWHLKNHSISRLLETVKRMKVKDQTQLHSFLILAHSVVDLFTDIKLESPNSASCKFALHNGIEIYPPCHLSIEVNNERCLIYLYFNKEALPPQRIQHQLHLMDHLSSIKGIPTIVDIQRGVIYKLDKVNDIESFIIKQDLDFIINYLNSQNMAA